MDLSREQKKKNTVVFEKLETSAYTNIKVWYVRSITILLLITSYWNMEDSSLNKLIERKLIG